MTDDQSDSDTRTAQRSQGVATCANCDAVIDLNTWTPVATDEQANVYRFCGETCRDEWRDG